MICCDSSGYSENDADGKCPNCGELTVDGQAVDCCGYSPCLCETCNHRPCDGSC